MCEWIEWQLIITDGIRLQIEEDGAGHDLAANGLAEECPKGLVTPADRPIAGHLSVRLDAMLQTIELPTAITDLDASLADVNGYNFAHFCSVWYADVSWYWSTIAKPQRTELLYIGFTFIYVQGKFHNAVTDITLHLRT